MTKCTIGIWQCETTQIHNANLLHRNANMLFCLKNMFLPLMRPFKWLTASGSISRGIRNTSSQTFGYPSLLNKVGLFCNF